MKGRPANPRAIAAMVRANKGKQLSPKQRAAISARFKGKAAHPNIAAAHKGKHGFGRGARDNPNHHRSKHWVIRDNRGVIHEFDNLESWCRANEWRFQPNTRPDISRPLWRQASMGIVKLNASRGKSQSYHGWTLVSVVERQEQGAPDLLGRRGNHD